MTAPSQLGRYTILHLLARGGMGDVYLARQEGVAGFEKLVVVKTLRADLAVEQRFRDMFFAEARIAALARHGNVVSVLDVGVDGDTCFLVMEYLEGWSLRTVLDACAARGRRMPLPYAVLVALDLSAGLEHVHGLRDEAGRSLALVHRDVSPENVMITIDGQSKLVDFGIAKTRLSGEETDPGTIKGKLRYLAPEQVTGGEVGPAVDQFALGAVLFEMCTGAPLFPAELPPMEVLYLIGAGELPDPAEAMGEGVALPEGLIAAMRRMLRVRPRDRFESCAHAADALIELRAMNRLYASRTDLVQFLRDRVAETSDDTGSVELARSGTAPDAPALAPRRAATGAGMRPAGQPEREDRENRDGDGARSDGSDDRAHAGPLAAHAEPPAVRGPDITEVDIPHGELLGRGDELAALRAALADGARLVSVVGPGGIGKTALVRCFAALARQTPDGLESVEDDRPEGDRPEGDRPDIPGERDGAGAGFAAWELAFCDLSEARTHIDVVYLVAGSLRVPLTSGSTWEEAVDQVGLGLAGRGTAMIVLDNAEQVAGALADSLPRWLHAAPEARFVTTSREPLKLAGERVIRLEPLSREDAAELLFRRVSAARKGWRPRPGDRSIAGHIVDALDRLPLAIELAGARGAVLSMPQLHQRLTVGLSWLRSQGRDVTPRHASLTEAIGWSWELLTSWEREALAQCSVFRGTFTPEAAAAVIELSAGAEGEEWPEVPTVPEVIRSLRDKSLLAQESREPDGDRADDGEAPQGGERPDRGDRGDRGEPGESEASRPARYRMYESIRHFASGKLGGERGAAEQRHLRFYLAEAERLVADADGPDGAASLRALAARLDNFTQAMATARRCDTGLAARLALAVERVFVRRGPARLHMWWLDAGLSAARAHNPRDPIARLLVARARARTLYGDAESARRDLVEAHAFADAVADPQLQATVSEGHGNWCLLTRALNEASGQYERALAGYAAAGDELGSARVRGALGLLHQRQGRYADAERCYDEALAACEHSGRREAAGNLYGRRGLFYLETQRPVLARADFERSIAIAEEFGNDNRASADYCNLGLLELEVGDVDAGRRWLERALALDERQGRRPSIAVAMINLGVADLCEGDYAAADARLGDAHALAVAVGYSHLMCLALGNRGIAAQGLGELERARELLEQAIERGADQPVSWPQLSVFMAHLGAVCAALGERRRARELFAACRIRIVSGDHAYVQGVIDCLEGFTDLAAVERAERAGDDKRARARLDLARRRAETEAPPSADLRIARALITAALAR